MTFGKWAIWLSAALLAVACTGGAGHGRSDGTGRGDPRSHQPASPEANRRPTATGPDPAPPTKPRSALAAEPWLAPATGPGHLAPRSRPSALPADVLVADHLNNRLIIIDPRGRVRWVFPRRGDLAPGQTFLVPDDAFFSPDGRYIVATQEEDQVISVIDVARHKIVYRYGKPGVPG